MDTSPSLCLCYCFSKAWTSFSPGQQPASPPNFQIRRASWLDPPRPFFLRPGPQGRRAQGSGRRGPREILFTVHISLLQGAAQLRSCLRAVANNGGRPSPRLLISQVPLLGMCLSLRVPVAAWKWTEAQRVTKRGSPCAARLPEAPGLCKAYF